jgi:hypothetical protein
MNFCIKCQTENFNLISLPCERSVCNECLITSINKISNDQFRCFSCNRMHAIDDIGSEKFPVFDLAMKLLEEKTRKLSSNGNYDCIEEEEEEDELDFDQSDNEDNVGEIDLNKELLLNLNSKLETLKKSIDELNLKKLNAEKSIKSHCDFLRNDIDLAADSVLQLVEEFREKLLKQIDNYEIDTLKAYSNNFKEKTKTKNDLETLIKNKETIYNQMKEEIEYPTMKMVQDKKDQIKKDLCQLHSHLKELKMAKNQFHQQIFNDKIIKFQKEIPSTQLIGFTHFYNKIIDFDDGFSKLDTEMIPFRRPFDSFINPIFLDNGDIFIEVLHFKTNASQSMFYILDSTFAQIKHQKSGVKDYINITYHFDNFVIILSTKNVNDHRVLSVLRSDLSQVASKSVKDSNYLDSICANSTEILLINDENKIEVYNWELDKLYTVGQSLNSTEPFYFQNLSLIDCKNDKIVLLDSNVIKIIDQPTGVLINSIQNVDCVNFVINPLNEIIFINYFNTDSVRLQFFNLNGRLTSDNKLIGDFKPKLAITGQSANSLLLTNYSSLEEIYHFKLFDYKVI